MGSLTSKAARGRAAFVCFPFADTSPARFRSQGAGGDQGVAALATLSCSVAAPLSELPLFEDMAYRVHIPRNAEVQRYRDRGCYARYLHPSCSLLQLIDSVPVTVQVAASGPHVSIRPCKRGREWAHCNVGGARSRSFYKTGAIPVINGAGDADDPRALGTDRYFHCLGVLVHPIGTLQLVDAIAVRSLVAAEDPRVSVGGAVGIGTYADPRRTGSALVRGRFERAPVPIVDQSLIVDGPGSPPAPRLCESPGRAVPPNSSFSVGRWHTGR